MLKHSQTAQLCLLVALCFCATSARAYCFFDAAQRFAGFGVTTPLLQAIARVESGMRPNALNRNKNGTEDIGIMQINSAWLPVLRKHGITRRDLFDPCTNIHVGAWVLAGNLKQYGATWRAVGAYNARSERKREVYVSKVWRQLIAMETRWPSNTGPLSMTVKLSPKNGATEPTTQHDPAISTRLAALGLDPEIREAP